MALVLVAIACIMVVTARFVAGGIVGPINQPIGAVYTQQDGFLAAGARDLDGQRHLLPRGRGADGCLRANEYDLKVRQHDPGHREYRRGAAHLRGRALAPFTKLGNDRGVSIVNNNLGNVYALQAGQFVAKAKDAENPDQGKALMEAAQDNFADAVTNHELAINDAEMHCAATNQQPNDASPLHRSAHRGGRASTAVAGHHRPGKNDVKNTSLRVAFVGIRLCVTSPVIFKNLAPPRRKYRDFGDKVQYESFDFHKKEKLPKLLAALNKIEAYGGQDFHEDVAGGLKLATELK
ncbi:unnamed protein product [Ectocarpus sp. CCAP 1310/34]|nr:unnamed protein product [Ectocarpus sp. CCAP 1310/34]